MGGASPFQDGGGAGAAAAGPGGLGRIGAHPQRGSAPPSRPVPTCPPRAGSAAAAARSGAAGGAGGRRMAADSAAPPLPPTRPAGPPRMRRAPRAAPRGGRGRAAIGCGRRAGETTARGRGGGKNGPRSRLEHPQPRSGLHPPIGEWSGPSGDVISRQRPQAAGRARRRSFPWQPERRPPQAGETGDTGRDWEAPGTAPAPASPAAAGIPR